MKKRCFLIFLLCLALLPALALASAPPVYTRAQIEARLDDLATTLHLKYFTTTGEGCNGTSYVSGHSCSKCMLQNVVAASSAFRTTSGLDKWPAKPASFSMNYGTWSTAHNAGNLNATTYSCRAFAGFAGWYLFAGKGTDTVQYHRLIDCKMTEAYKYACPGDIIDFGHHAMIYISGTSSKLTVLDCNAARSGYGQCVVQKRVKSATSEMVTISRAANYACRTEYRQINSDELDGHQYRLYSGSCSWEEANAFVSSLGAGWHLAAIGSAEEQNVIAAMAAEWNGSKYGGMAWLGARYTGGQWTWVTGEPFAYTNWQKEPASPASTPYAVISGVTNTKSAHNTQKDKWKAVSALNRFYMPGFVAEYTPPLEAFDGTVYDLYATMTVSAPEADLYSAPGTDAYFLRTLQGGETIHTRQLLAGSDGSRWCLLDSGAYVSYHALRYVSNDKTAAGKDLMTPAALQPLGMPFSYGGSVTAEDSLLMVGVTLTNQTAGRELTGFWYAPEGGNVHTVALADIAGDMPLMDLSAYEAGSYEMTLRFYNAAEQSVFTIRSPFTVAEQGCAHVIAFPYILREPDCTQAGLAADYCTVCQRVLDRREALPSLEHAAGEWTVAQAPSSSAHGREELHCSACDAVMKSRVIPGAGFAFVDRKTDAATGREYILMSGSTSWTNARAYAESLGSGYQLACMDGDSTAEQGIIQALAEELGKACWLGGSCAEGSWLWLSGKPIDTADGRWASGQPSGVHGSSPEMYLGVYGDSAQTSYAEKGKWNDFSVSSSTVKGFVIEYAPHAVSCPAHLTMTAGGEYPLLTGTRGAAAWRLAAGGENAEIVDNSGETVLRAVQAGYAVVEFTGADGSTALLGVTIMPEEKRCAIVLEDDGWDGVLSAGFDRTFRLELQGPADGCAAAPVWSIEGSAAIVTADGYACTVSALGNGSATLRVSVEVVMEDGFLNPTETWTAEIDMATLIPDDTDITCSMPDGSAADKLDYLRGVFLEGWYFNLHTAAPAGEVQYRIHAGESTVGVSSIPCDHTACSTYWGHLHGTRATGYARTVYYLVWGHEQSRDSYMFIYNPEQDNFDFLLGLAPGDVIYTGSHSMVVTGVEGDTVYVTDCNADGDCRIRWDAVYSLAELENLIRATGKGRVYTPAFRDMPKGSMANYVMHEGKSMSIYSHPFNDSRKLDSLEGGEVFPVDLSHTYVNTNASYGAGTWALCYAQDKEPGWVLISDESYCAEEDLGEELVEHIAVTAPSGEFDLETFRADLLAKDYGKYFTGVVSGILEEAEIVIRPVNPLSGETGDITARWSGTFIPGFRSEIDFSEKRARFTEEELYSLGEGAYRCMITIRYTQGGEAHEWTSPAASTVLWLTTPETSFPNDCEPAVLNCDAITEAIIPVYLGSEPFNMLYAGIEMLSGEDVGDVTWSWDEGQLILRVERLQPGEVSFELRVADGVESYWWSIITVNFRDCAHEDTAYMRSTSCLEEGYWCILCLDCGEMLLEGEDVLDAHEWHVAACTPSDGADGQVGKVECTVCGDMLQEEMIIPASRCMQLPWGLEALEEEALCGVGAAQITVPAGVTSIGARAFADCSSLVLVILPDTVQQIAADALEGSPAVLLCSAGNAYVIDWARANNMPLYIME